MRVKLTKPRKGLQGLDLLQARIQKNSAETVMHLAKVALEAAVTHTPKWSGAATESWKFSLNGEKSPASDVPVFLDTPVFEDGIHDSKAAAFNRTVINKELSRIRLAVYAKVRAGKDVKLTLYNAQPYAQKWLSEKSTLAVLLRVVNQDYYTFNDICNEVRLAARLARFGKW